MFTTSRYRRLRIPHRLAMVAAAICLVFAFGVDHYSSALPASASHDKASVETEKMASSIPDKADQPSGTRSARQLLRLFPLRF